MEGKTTHKVQLLRVVLLLSISVNAFFVWSYHYHYDAPDINFYPQGLRDAYFIKRHIGGDTFVTEHLGHRYTAKCKDTLSWPNGIYTLGSPMSEGCTYMTSLVVKSIAAGIMREEGGALVYQPWEQDDTVQTADILTIIDDKTN